MPTPSRELRQPIFLPIKKLPIEPVPSPEMGLFDPQEHLLSRSGIVVNRRGRIVQLEVIGSNEAAVEEYTREVRIAVNVTLSRSNFSEVNHSKAEDIDTPPRPFIASADKSLVNQPKTRSIDTLLQQRQVVRDEIVTNPNHLVIFLNFAGFLTESTEKNLRNLRENYRYIDSLWQHKDLQEKGVRLNPPRGDMYDIRLVIDPPISQDANHDYPGMQANAVNLNVDVSGGSGSVTATLTPDGRNGVTKTAQGNQLADLKDESNPPGSTSIYRLKVVGGAGGGKYQVTGLWKNFIYDEQFVEVASRGTKVL